MTRKDAKYAEALDTLDRLRATGQISPNDYEVKRATLLREAASPMWSVGRTVNLVLVIIVALILLAMVVLALTSRL